MDCELINNKENSNEKKKLSPLAKLLGVNEETIKDTKTKASSDTSDDDEKVNFQNSKIYETEINLNDNKSFEHQNLSNYDLYSFQDFSNLNFNKHNYFNSYEKFCHFYNNHCKNNQENVKKISPIYFFYYGIDQFLKKEIKGFVDKNNRNFIEKKIYYNNYKNNYYYYIQFNKKNSYHGINNDNDKNINQNNLYNNNNTSIQKNNNNENIKYKKGKPFVGRNGDWICSICRNLNFAFRIMCNRCHLSKKESEKIIFAQFDNQNFIFSNLNYKQNSIKSEKVN